jgi:dolichol-phosphate mannosyltransferase
MLQALELMKKISITGICGFLEGLRGKLPELPPVQNHGLNGFGRAVVCGIEQSRGDYEKTGS